MKEFRLLPILLAGYLFLLIFRPYEYWPILGEFRVERVYMLCFMAVVFLSKEKRFLPDSLNGTIIFFSIVLLLSGMFSISWDASWKVIEDYLKYVVFYFMVILCVRDERDFRFIILAFIGVMFLYVGKSAWEFFVHGRHVYRMGIARMIGIDTAYGDPNSFAATICYSLPFFWALIRYRFDSTFIRYALWLYGIIALIAILMTGSRSGMVTALFFLFFVLMLSSRKTLIFCGIGISLIVLWSFTPPELQDRFLSIFYDDVGPENAQQSAAQRFECFRHGLDLFIAHPFFGVGPGVFPLTWESGLNAHNLLAQVLGETGLFGAIAFLTMLYLLLSKNITIIKNLKKSNTHFCDQNFISKRQNGVSLNCSRNGKINSISSIDDHKYLSFGTIKEHYFLLLIPQAIIMTVALMIFKGWGDHNLYRYTWLWISALTVLCWNFSLNFEIIYRR